MTIALRQKKLTKQVLFQNIGSWNRVKYAYMKTALGRTKLTKQDLFQNKECQNRFTYAYMKTALGRTKLAKKDLLNIEYLENIPNTAIYVKARSMNLHLHPSL